MPSANEPGARFAMGRVSRAADRLTGERMVADEVAWLAGKAEELLAGYWHAAPSRRGGFRTFAQVEQLWDEVIRPVLPRFKSMQGSFGAEPPPEGSVWRENWPLPEVRWCDRAIVS